MLHTLHVMRSGLCKGSWGTGGLARDRHVNMTGAEEETQRVKLVTPSRPACRPEHLQLEYILWENVQARHMFDQQRQL